MSRMKLGTLALACCLFAACARAEDENPYKNAKVGDWVEYKTATKAAGMEMEGSQKMTVSKKTDEELTLDIAINMMGQEMKQTTTIKLNEKYDPMKAQFGNGEAKQTGSGEEKITVGGKSYDTKWVEVEVTAKTGAQETKSKAKVWSSTAVPLGGMVKMESDAGGMGKVKMELTGHSGK